MPKQVDHEARRRQIAAATRQAIDELGVDGLSMRAIADRAGCTTGRLTHYFASREALLLGALRDAHRQAALRMTVAAGGRTGRDALRAVLCEALPLDDERRTEWRVWMTFWAQAVSTESLRDEHRQRYTEWRGLVASLVSAASPALARAEVGRITDTLLATVDGLGMQTMMTADEASARRARRAIDATLDQLLTS
jgi:AcrR family transcriptional regulator